jgi:serpin B
MHDVRRGHRRRFGAVLLTTLVAVTACGSPTPSATPNPTVAQANMPSPTATPTPTTAVTPTASPSPTAMPVAQLIPGTVALTVSDSVRVRSRPRVASDSILYQPVLPAGTSLLVTGGPVVADGYTWIEVAPLSMALQDGIDRGWVAVADHDGTPWVAVAPDSTPGYALASAPVAMIAGSLASAKQEAAQANAFGIALYQRLLRSGTVPASNGLVFSPTSIVDALAMARAGARSTTATQMDAVLHAGGWDQLSLGIASLDAQLASRDGTFTDADGTLHTLALRLANTAFVQTGFPVQNDYLTRLGKTFGAGVALVDFAANPQGAVDAINGWVKRQTVGRIPVIVNLDNIKPTTRLALVNAVYLKANWATAFRPADTASAAFRRSDGTLVNVAMMMRNGGQEIGLATGPGWKATELSYLGAAGTPLEMTLVLPDDLRTFERGLSTALIAKIQSSIAAQEAYLHRSTPATSADHCGTYPYAVELRLPKFGVDTSLTLASLLGSMGMPLAVTRGSADFTGINPGAGLYISQVIHKATIDVDEKGTTAAAATAVIGLTGGCTGPQPARIVPLTFNRPFLFLIRDVQTGAILFIGRVTDPNQR